MGKSGLGTSLKTFLHLFGASSGKKLHASPLSKYLSPLFDEVFLIKDKYCFVYVCVNI